MFVCWLAQVQRLFFKHVHKLRDLALANCGSVEKRDTLRKYLNLLQPEELKFLVTQQLRYRQWLVECSVTKYLKMTPAQAVYVMTSDHGLSMPRHRLL